MNIRSPWGKDGRLVVVPLDYAWLRFEKRPCFMRPESKIRTPHPISEFPWTLQRAYCPQGQQVGSVRIGNRR